MTGTTTSEWAQLLEDEETRLLVAQYASEMPDRIKLLQQAITTRDHAWLKRLAHQIKGSAGLYGFPELSARAAELEFFIQTSGSDTALAAATDAIIEQCRRPHAWLEQCLEGRR